MKKFLLPVIVSILLLPATGASGMNADLRGLAASMAKSNKVRIQYFDPRISRRTIYAVPSLGSNNADYIVTIKCLHSCAGRLNLYESLLSHAKPQELKCLKPIYAELIIMSDDEIIDAAYFDKQGSCMTYHGAHFGVSGSVIHFLDNTPLGEW